MSPSGPRDRIPAAAPAASPSPTPQPVSQPDPLRSLGDARRYNSAKRMLALGRAGVGSLFILALVWTGWTSDLEGLVRQTSGNDFVVLIGFLLLVGLLEGFVSFPLRLFSGYILEHRFRLSNQSFGAWLWELVKSSLVGSAIGLPLAVGLYACLGTFGALWWVPVAGAVFLVSILLARIAPTVIFPLFYTFRPISDTALSERLVALCRGLGVSVEGVYVFNMSKTTKKANAAFAGIGRSKRIILGDTLIANFTDEEIETVLAHELGHERLGHLWIMLGAGFVSSFAGLAASAAAYDALLPLFDIAGRTSIAGLPLLGLLLGLSSLITSVPVNMLSRAHERAADRFAVRATGRPSDFANALRKLATVNLAELQPPPLIEFLFHSHPSLSRRIDAIEGSTAIP